MGQAKSGAGAKGAERKRPIPLLEGVHFGASYYPPHHATADWERDLDQMAEAGLTVIRTAELIASWEQLEPAKGDFDFAWLDRLFDLAGDRGQQVLLGTGSASPPIWMTTEYPDLPIVSRDEVTYPTNAI